MPPFPTSYDPARPEERAVPLPSAPLEPLTPHLSLQPPLSRRGHGPGVLLLLPPLPKEWTQRAETLDPDPVTKWAEEGYAVLCVDSGVQQRGRGSGVADALLQGIDALKKHASVDVKDKYAVLAYNPDVLQAIVSALAEKSLPICLVASFCGPVPTDCPVPYIEHIYASPPSSIPNGDHTDEGAGTSEGSAEQGELKADVIEVSQCPIPRDDYHPSQEERRSFTYTTRTGSPFSVLPEYGSGIYDKSAAGLVHTRTLSFLKPKIGGPWFDLETIWDQHTWYEFIGRSVAQTMGTMVAEPYVNHIPTMIGGTGREALTAFYRDHFIFTNPPDVFMQTVSRTVGIDRIVDETVFHCTHSTVFEWLLPGVPPTGKKLEIPLIAIVGLRGDRLAHEHIWWDQATAMVQVGLLPEHVAYESGEMAGKADAGEKKRLRLPAAGVEVPRKLLDETARSNEMLGEEWGVQVGSGGL